MEVVLGESGLEVDDHLAERLRSLVADRPGLEVEVAGDAAQAGARFLGGQHQFAVTAVLGWVECHRRTVY